jgi:hypothetical protein
MITQWIFVAMEPDTKQKNLEQYLILINKLFYLINYSYLS